MELATDFLMQIIAGLIVVAIIGATSFITVMYRCIKQQALDMKLMKKATAFVLRRQVQTTRHLHPEMKDELEDLEKTYKDLIRDTS